MEMFSSNIKMGASEDSQHLVSQNSAESKTRSHLTAQNQLFMCNQSNNQISSVAESSKNNQNNGEPTKFDQLANESIERPSTSNSFNATPNLQNPSLNLSAEVHTEARSSIIATKEGNEINPNQSEFTFYQYSAQGKPQTHYNSRDLNQTFCPQ